MKVFYGIILLSEGVLMKKIFNKDLRYLNKIRISHRGLWDYESPENSIGAFKRCIDENIPIEFDVHLLKDGTLVVFHDDNLLRMTGKDMLIRNATYDDIKDLKLKDTDYGIPTFDEVLELVSGSVLLDIEIKCDVKGVKILEELTKRLDKYKGKFIVKSFNPFYIWWFRVNRPNIVRGLLVSKLKKKKMNRFFKYALSKMWFNFLAKPDFIAFDYRDLPNKRIKKLQKKGIPILLFTLSEDDIVKYDNDYNGFLYEEKRK